MNLKEVKFTAFFSYFLLFPLFFLIPLFTFQVMQMFKGCRREDTAPHIYGMAQAAYRHLLTTQRDQSIVLLGRSGSGKTTNCQHIIQYLLTIAGSTNKTFSCRSEIIHTPGLSIHIQCCVMFCLYTLSIAEKWQAVYTVLEAFGNASTCMNGSASRFSHIVSLDFDQAGLVTSASIQVQINMFMYSGLWGSTSVSGVISDADIKLRSMET